MKYYIALDGGTSNTRLRLFGDGRILSSRKLPVGAGTAGGGERWRAAISEAALALLSENRLSERDIRAIVGAGMITSEYGLCPLSHLPAPAGLSELSGGLCRSDIEGLSIPCYFVPGVKQLAASAESSDMMRGEEAEVVGLLPYGGTDTVYILPGTHAKHVFVDKEGRIASFKTFMTGEMIGALSSGTILRDAVDLSVEGFSEEALLRGYDAALRDGLGAALFKTRIMKNLFSEGKRSTYSFFLGALLSDEIRSLLSAGARRVLVAGKASLRLPTECLLRHRTEAQILSCPEGVIENASALGAIRIFESAER